MIEKVNKGIFVFFSSALFACYENDSWKTVIAVTLISVIFNLMINDHDGFNYNEESKLECNVTK